VGVMGWAGISLERNYWCLRATDSPQTVQLLLSVIMSCSSRHRGDRLYPAVSVVEDISIDRFRTYLADTMTKLSL
jgi:hypothetical protein